MFCVTFRQLSSCDFQTDGSFQSFSFGNCKARFRKQSSRLGQTGLDVKAVEATQAPKLGRSEVDRFDLNRFAFSWQGLHWSSAGRTWIAGETANRWVASYWPACSNWRFSELAGLTCAGFFIRLLAVFGFPMLFGWTVLHLRVARCWEMFLVPWRHGTRQFNATCSEKVQANVSCASWSCFSCCVVVIIVLLLFFHPFTLWTLNTFHAAVLIFWAWCSGGSAWTFWQWKDHIAGGPPYSVCSYHLWSTCHYFSIVRVSTVLESAMSLRLFLAVHHEGTQPQCSSTERQHGREDLAFVWRGGKTLAEIGSRCGSKEHQTPKQQINANHGTLDFNQQDSDANRVHPDVDFIFAGRGNVSWESTSTHFLRISGPTTLQQPPNQWRKALWLCDMFHGRTTSWVPLWQSERRPEFNHKAVESVHHPVIASRSTYERCVWCVCFRLSTWCLYARL